jgi:isocitrate/isopropylmalate dehydrogenase
MTSFHIAVLPGDGIGPEVIAEGVKALHAVEAFLSGVEFTLTAESGRGHLVNRDIVLWYLPRIGSAT